MTPRKMLWESRGVPIKGKARNCLEVLESQSLFLTKSSLTLNGRGFWLTYPLLIPFPCIARERFQFAYFGGMK